MEQLPGEGHFKPLQWLRKTCILCNCLRVDLRKSCCYIGVRLLSVLEAIVLPAISGGTTGKVRLPSSSRQAKHFIAVWASGNSCDRSTHADPLLIAAFCWVACRHVLIAVAVCRFNPATSDFNELKRLLTFSTKFVNSLHLQQLPSHLDLQIIFEAMRRYVLRHSAASQACNYWELIRLRMASHQFVADDSCCLLYSSCMHQLQPATDCRQALFSHLVSGGGKTTSS